ncbi:hypothetical protein GGR52DRAFT_164393 [Hypoxylon sp. FL1284]|nr:hypothetical protein GGR52DRAFT_164393 [Hypoxylon sp. FL1284]
MGQGINIFTALIRTHHITNRKKLARVRKAASLHSVNVLVRSNGSPGIMYAEGASEAAVTSWVDAVQALRYKDFQCPWKPAANRARSATKIHSPSFEEVGSVAEFSSKMDQRGLGDWWKIGMGYRSSEKSLI